MQIRSITVGSQLKVPHPNIDFAAVSGLVNITANLAPDDDLYASTTELQAMADVALEKYMDGKVERMKQRAPATKPQAATAKTASSLAEKHGAKW